MLQVPPRAFSQESISPASPAIRPASGGDGGIGRGRVHISRTPAEVRMPSARVSGDHSSIDCDVTIARVRPAAKSDRSSNGVGYRARIDNQRGLRGRRVSFGSQKMPAIRGGH